MRTPRLILALLVIALAANATLVSLLPQPLAALAPRTGPALATATTWGYQLQNVDARLISDEIDVLVVDHSRDGSIGRALTPADVSALQRRSDGRVRVVLSYLSIGEAETYRSYWNPEWTRSPPRWLGAENAAWKGNYGVQYWDPAWQRLIYDAASRSPALRDRFWRLLSSDEKPYLDRILEAGFDGVYLDRVDAFEKAGTARPTAQAEMIGFVRGISVYAKARRTGFLIVPQNGEELLADDSYRRVIDGVAKEDLFYGVTGDGVANDPIETRKEIAHLNRAKADGLPVFVIEYLTDPSIQRSVEADVRGLGFLPLFAERPLTLPPVLPPR